jgi:hypothetical protein
MSQSLRNSGIGRPLDLDPARMAFPPFFAASTATTTTFGPPGATILRKF